MNAQDAAEIALAKRMLDHAARRLLSALGDASGPIKIQFSIDGDPTSIVHHSAAPLDPEDVPEILTPELKDLLAFCASTYASSEAWKPIAALLEQGVPLQTNGLCELTKQKPGDIKHLLADLVEREALKNDPRRGYEPTDKAMMALLCKLRSGSALECTSDPTRNGA